GKYKSLKYKFTVVAASVRESWRKRYLQITTDSKLLEYWREREKNILNRFVKSNNEHLEENKNPSVKDARAWLSEIWPFGKDCERLYKLPDDLDAIYLAIGLRLDTLFRTRNPVTEEMIEAIVGEWQFADELRLGKESVLFCFGPWFNGEIMAYDDPLELFWGYIEADLQAHGFDSLGDDEAGDNSTKAESQKSGITQNGKPDNVGKRVSKGNEVSGSRVIAMQSFDYALGENKALLTASQAEIYQWLLNPDNKECDKNPYHDCKPPKEESWKAYLREYCNTEHTSIENLRQRHKGRWALRDQEAAEKKYGSSPKAD
ncbi:hypothetical protein KAT92_05275, partial [Candidatus Babeliales bacterium]|nr:hypothetical protein [Candidatus Babeliales bacterium]